MQHTFVWKTLMGFWLKPDLKLSDDIKKAADETLKHSWRFWLLMHDRGECERTERARACVCTQSNSMSL